MIGGAQVSFSSGQKATRTTNKNTGCVHLFCPVECEARPHSRRTSPDQSGRRPERAMLVVLQINQELTPHQFTPSEFSK
jgi:hypothetical protein